MAQIKSNQVSQSWKNAIQGMSPESLGIKPKPFTPPKTQVNPTSFTGPSAAGIKSGYNAWGNTQTMSNPSFNNPLTMTGNTGRGGAVTQDRSALTGALPTKLPTSQDLQQQAQTAIGGNKVSSGSANSLNLNVPAYGSIGLSNLRNQASQNGATGSGAVNTATSNQTTQNTSNPNAEKIAALTGQMNALQSQLDAKRAAQTTGGTTGQTTGGATGQGNTYQGILSNLGQVATNTKEQDRVRKEMESVARQNQAIGDEAKRVSDQYGAEINRVGQLGAGAVAGNLSTGSNVVGTGNAAIASQSASSRMAALAQGQAAALKGTEQQLTAQQQTTEGLAPSLNAALTQQQTGVTGLSNQGTLAQPVQVPYSNQFINPQTGQSAGGAGLGGYAGYNAAQQAIELAGQYPDAGVQYDPNLSPEQNLQRVQQAIQGSPTYQRGTFGTAGAESYIGAQQLGAAGDLTSKVANIASAVSTADANFELMMKVASDAGINDANVPILNTLKNKLGVNFQSDPNVVAFNQLINSLRGQYAQILGGGSATNENLADAKGAIPDNVSMSALTKLQQTLKAEGNNRISAYNQQIGAYSGGGQGGTGGGGDWSW